MKKGSISIIQNVKSQDPGQPWTLLTITIAFEWYFDTKTTLNCIKSPKNDSSP